MMESFMANITNQTSQPIDPWPRFSETVNYVIIVAAIIIIITGIVGNLGVLLVVIRDPGMRTPMYLCLSSLSVSDLLVLFITPIIPVSTLFNNPPVLLGEFACYITSVFDRGSLICSVLTVLLISVERYIVTHHPMRAAFVITTSRTVISLALIWLLSYGLTVPLVDMTYYRPYNVNGTAMEDCGLYAEPWHDVLQTVISVTFYFPPLLAVTVLNTFIVRKVLAEPPCHSGSTVGTSSMRRTRRQAVKMIVLIVILFILCTAPFQIFLLIEIYFYEIVEGLGMYDWITLLWVGRFLAYVNSAANPVIYSIVSTKFRAALFGSVLCCRRKINTKTRTGTTCETVSYP